MDQRSFNFEKQCSLTTQIWPSLKLYSKRAVSAGQHPGRAGLAAQQGAGIPLQLHAMHDKQPSSALKKSEFIPLHYPHGKVCHITLKVDQVFTNAARHPRTGTREHSYQLRID
jgi:hypothetical protein